MIRYYTKSSLYLERTVHIFKGFILTYDFIVIWFWKWTFFHVIDHSTGTNVIKCFSIKKGKQDIFLAFQLEIHFIPEIFKNFKFYNSEMLIFFAYHLTDFDFSVLSTRPGNELNINWNKGLPEPKNLNHYISAFK